MTEKNILIDLRTDPSAGTVDVNGVAINSPAQINALLDHLKSVGYNTVTFNFDVPIDLRTGNIVVTPVQGTNALPSASLWQDIAYAHSIGLAVNALAIPAVVINSDGTANGSDAPISTSTPLAAGVNITTVFASITSYETTMAKLAQQNHVETFFVGTNDVGYDSAAYTAQWQQVITAVRSVYTGTIAYRAPYDNAVFGLVDQIDFVPNPIVSTTPMYNLAQIVEGYYHTTGWTNGPTYIQEIATLVKEYGTKPIILDSFQEQSANIGIGDTFYSFGLLMADPTAISTLPQPNYREQALAFEAFLYVAQHLVNNQISGVGMSEYAPWAQAAWIQNPGNSANNQLWNLMIRDGDTLWGNATAEAAITQSFTTNLLPNYFFSTPGNDTVLGNTGAVNTAVFYASSTASNITKTSTGLTVATPTDGLDTLSNIQRLKFSDVSMAFDTGITQSSGMAALLIGAVLPGQLALDVSKQSLLGSVVALFDSGYSINDLSGAVLRLPIWSTLTGKETPTSADIANYLLSNVNGVAPTQTALTGAVTALNTEAHQGDWLVALATSGAGQNHIGLVGIQAHGLEYVS